MSMYNHRPYIIRAVYEWITESDCRPYLLVDALDEGVQVPPDCVQDNQIVLDISPMAVRNLELANELITFSARFSGQVHDISIPTASVISIYSCETGQGAIFEMDGHGFTSIPVGPLEVETDENGSPLSPPGADDSPPPQQPVRGRPNLTVVK